MNAPRSTCCNARSSRAAAAVGADAGRRRVHARTSGASCATGRAARRRVRDAACCSCRRSSTGTTCSISCPGRASPSGSSREGHDVYCIDWGTPGRRGPLPHLRRHRATATSGARIRRRADAPRRKAHVLGYCLGGTLAAIHAAAHPERDGVAHRARRAGALRRRGPARAWTRTPDVRRRRARRRDRQRAVAAHAVALSPAPADAQPRPRPCTCSTARGTTSSSTASSRSRPGATTTCRSRASATGATSRSSTAATRSRAAPSRSRGKPARLEAHRPAPRSSSPSSTTTSSRRPARRRSSSARARRTSTPCTCPAGTWARWSRAGLEEAVARALRVLGGARRGATDRESGGNDRGAAQAFVPAKGAAADDELGDAARAPVTQRAKSQAP